MERAKPCTFCDISLAQWGHFERYGRDRIDLKVLYENDYVFVKPDILPATPDGLHLLLIAKPHTTAFAQVNGAGHEIGHLLYQIEQDIGEPLVYFEHGSGLPKLGYGETKNQSIYHTHAHLMPARGAVLQYMAGVLTDVEHINFRWNEDTDSNPVGEVARLYNGHPYMYIQSGSLGIFAEDDGTMGSQIAQRNMSRYFGREVNWKLINEDEEMARLSVARIANIVDKCHR